MALSILIVDDEPRLRALVARILRQRGHTVFEAGTALEAIEIIQRESLDLAIIDYELGTPLTGFDVAKHTKLGTDRVLITGYDPSELRPKVEDPLRLFREILRKPPDWKFLFSIVDTVEKSKEDTQP